MKQYDGLTNVSDKPKICKNCDNYDKKQKFCFAQMVYIKKGEYCKSWILRQRRRKTNFDKIAKSPKKLAKFLAGQMTADCSNCALTFICESCCDRDCNDVFRDKKLWRQWLERETCDGQES